MSETKAVKAKGQHGGRRPGAGAPKKPVDATDESDPLEFLRKVMMGLIDPSPSQLKAAIAAAQCVSRKGSSSGKKGALAEKAGEVMQGRFGSRPAPLKVVNGGSGLDNSAP